MPKQPAADTAVVIPFCPPQAGDAVVVVACPSCGIPVCTRAYVDASDMEREIHVAGDSGLYDIDRVCATVLGVHRCGAIDGARQVASIGTVRVEGR